MAINQRRGPEATYEAGKTGAGYRTPDTVHELPEDVVPSQRQPKGDHNRRLAMFLEPEEFAAEAGVTVDELREYEHTGPDGRFDLEVARRVGEALDRLEAVTPSDRKITS
jgi:hypothetical protein